MTTLDLTVLGYEGPQLRAYLTAMRRGGFRPRRLIRMMLTRHPATGAVIGRGMPRTIRSWYAGRVQDYSLNYWPRRIGRHGALVESMLRALRVIRRDAAELVAEMQARRFAYERYAERVDRVPLSGLDDAALPAVLGGAPSAVVLYTGGGRVPRAVLDTPGVRLVHVHPGRLPAVRGADGVLWSMLVYGHPSMSAFTMAAGIDTGSVIAVRDYPAPVFELPPATAADDRTCYRALFSVYDPVLRADFWVREVLEAHPDLERLPAVPQDGAAGCTYHFMHPALRRRVLARLFRTDRAAGDAAPRNRRQPGYGTQVPRPAQVISLDDR